MGKLSSLQTNALLQQSKLKLHLKMRNINGKFPMKGCVIKNGWYSEAYWDRWCKKGNSNENQVLMPEPKLVVLRRQPNLI